MQAAAGRVARARTGSTDRTRGNWRTGSSGPPACDFAPGGTSPQIRRQPFPRPWRGSSKRPARPATDPTALPRRRPPVTSMRRNRRSNLALARRSAAPKSTLPCRDRLAQTNSTSPSSSSSAVVADASGEFGADLLDLLVQLVEHRVHVRPVEADARGALLQLHRALPLRQSARDAGQRAGVAPPPPRARRSALLARSQASVCASTPSATAHARRTHADAGAPSCR